MTFKPVHIADVWPEVSEILYDAYVESMQASVLLYILDENEHPLQQGVPIDLVSDELDEMYEGSNDT